MLSVIPYIYSLPHLGPVVFIFMKSWTQHLSYFKLKYIEWFWHQSLFFFCYVFLRKIFQNIAITNSPHIIIIIIILIIYKNSNICNITKLKIIIPINTAIQTKTIHPIMCVSVSHCLKLWHAVWWTAFLFSSNSNFALLFSSMIYEVSALNKIKNIFHIFCTFYSGWGSVSLFQP